MTTKDAPQVIVEPDGYVTACAWCLTCEQLIDLSRRYRVTHSVCPACEATLMGECDREQEAQR